MTDSDRIHQYVQRLPENMQSEVLRFVENLLFESLESSVLSEQALAKDWNRPEEDQAWQGLPSVRPE